MKAASVVKEFARTNEYQKISFERNGILYHKRRMLQTENVNAACEMRTIMKDLSLSTFCVPVIYKHPPLVYSLINEIHWY